MIAAQTANRKLKQDTHTAQDADGMQVISRSLRPLTRHAALKIVHEIHILLAHQVDRVSKMICSISSDTHCIQPVFTSFCELTY